jgi:hypothetical protein
MGEKHERFATHTGVDDLPERRMARLLNGLRQRLPKQLASWGFNDLPRSGCDAFRSLPLASGYRTSAVHTRLNTPESAPVLSGGGTPVPVRAKRPRLMPLSY